jgi:hypothetical protein
VIALRCVHGRIELDQHVVERAAEQLGGGSAPLDSSRMIVSSAPRPNAWISLVLAMVGWPPLMDTAPPLMPRCG